jgi:hypothetical protein
MFTRSAPCRVSEWLYARETAAQWPEATATWAKDRVIVTVDAPLLHPADEACLLEQVIDAVGKAARIFAVVRRGRP